MAVKKKSGSASAKKAKKQKLQRKQQKKKQLEAKKAKVATATKAAGPDANWRALLEKGVAGDGARSSSSSSSAAAKRRQQKRDRPGADESATYGSSIDWTRRNAKSMEARMVALDCEMVGVGTSDESRLARVCVVNERGEVMLDRYSKPMEEVTNYRTQFSGIRPSDLKGAPSFWEVQVEVADLVRGKMLVGHQLRSDLEVLMLKHPRSLLRDTALYAPLRRVNAETGRTHAAKLRDLCLNELGKVIQDGEHDPYVDARAALEIYKKHSTAWERRVLELRAARHTAREKKRDKRGSDRDILPSTIDLTTKRTEPSGTLASESVSTDTQADVFARPPRTRKHKRS
ncbi:RNA exonuclease 4 [Hondaea fermentalgiana]|uniref:RNA exonuclease 4 n=1 Tax=Hondaea fermentalgiana TaxID=2315210 RepID=A0A2R5GSF9_9STRA|nr:RNA exonuclease 4 [Hondaea fermentalgiana]|eukprot:GBG30814.1 RNA exonuclease 4 [Hondaea fermentalgiana]